MRERRLRVFWAQMNNRVMRERAKAKVRKRQTRSNTELAIEWYCAGVVWQRLIQETVGMERERFRMHMMRVTDTIVWGTTTAVRMHCAVDTDYFLATKALMADISGTLHASCADGGPRRETETEHTEIRQSRKLREGAGS